MSSLLRRLISRRRLLLLPPATKSFSTATASAANRGSLLLRRPSSPWLMLPPSFIMEGVRGDMVYNFYSPITGKVESFNNRGGKEETELMMDVKTDLVGSSHGWLVLFHIYNQRMFLLNPISGRRIELPPITRWPEPDRRSPLKVLLSSSPDEKDCVVVAMLASEYRAAFCRPGDAEWTPLGAWLPDLLESGRGWHKLHYDFVHSAARKTLFGLWNSRCCRQTGLEGWDMTAEPAGQITVRVDQLSKLDRGMEFPGTYLVCGGDKLFVVMANVDSDIEFSVYRIPERSRRGVEVKLESCSSLDDMAMFVGMNHSFAVKASEYPGLKGNCIYYSDPRLIYPKGQFVGMFDIKTKKCTPLYFDSLRLKPFIYFPWFIPSLD